jgi:hypothetical protein
MLYPFSFIFFLPTNYMLSQVILPSSIYHLLLSHAYSTEKVKESLKTPIKVC